MSVRIGDAAFSRDGLPVVVKDRDPLTAKLRVDTDPQSVREQMRHGYINGLAPEQRTQLYEILDSAKNAATSRERVDQLAAKLAEIEEDPRNFALTKYLRAEMLHIMNSNGLKPREYTVDENKVR